MESILDRFHVDKQSPALVEAQIEAYLEANIRNGRLPVGLRFPSTPDLARLWHVNLVAVHRAMRGLKLKGLVERKVRVGTRVASRTERMAVALLVGPRLEDEAAGYYRALVAALQKEVAARGWEHCLLQDVAAGLRRRSAAVEDEDDSEDPLAEVLTGRCRGVFVIGLLPKRTEILRERLDVPMVLCNDNVHHTDVANDVYRFGWEAVEHLSAQGCKRLAFLGSWDGSPAILGVREAASELGLPEPLVRAVTPQRGRTREEMVLDALRPLLDAWQQGQDRVDALIVADDVSMIAVSQAVQGGGLGVNAPAMLVTTATEGVPRTYAGPVLRYEFPVRRRAEIALEILEQRLRGEEPSRLPILVRGSLRV